MMKSYNKIYESIEEPGTFTLLDSTHPLPFYVGIDDYGRKCILIRGKTKPNKLKSTSAIDISIGQVNNSIWSLGFHLSQNSMSGLFYRFCDDIVEASRNLPSSVDGIIYVIKRYNSWKKMFYTLKTDILSESEIMGLIGELLFLKNFMLKNYTEDIAISSWSGCDKTHKDFSVNNDWYEIKSSSINSLTLKISSMEQLSSENDGHLISYEFEKMSETFNGYSLNNLIRDLLNEVTPESGDIILAKLKSIGWEYNDNYDKYIYRLVKVQKYLVNPNFPKIDKSKIHSAIVKVQYEILKRDLIDFVED